MRAVRRRIIDLGTAALNRMDVAVLRLRYRRRGIEAINEALLRRTTGVAELLAAFGATVAPGAQYHHGPVVIHNADGCYRNLHISENVHIGRACLLDLAAPLWIGREATISMGCTLLTHVDVGDRPLRDRLPPNREPLRIGDGCYLGANVTVLPGCTIGERAIIAAGAVVAEPVPAEAIVGGVPARPLRRSDVRTNSS